MSRSRRKPVVVLSPKIDKDVVHGQVRAHVRDALLKAVDEPDCPILDADVKDLGLEDWGTKFDYQYMDPDQAIRAQDRRDKAGRK
ncbi:MAG TPA: hypothetical protein PLL20_21835 [Phycisphaerae bacterium]|nr:hypothetical protein [Phycisphaerae bacterium]